jgi:hypothetical protein
MTLSSRTFESKDGLNEALSCVRRAFAEKFYEADLEMEIAIRPKAGSRSKRETMPKADQGEPKDWAKGDYDFRFSKGEFFWKGVRMHITAGEALFLRRWLVDGNLIAREKYYLRNIRNRHGSDFLADI